MKTSLFSFLLCLASATFAQHWQPFLASDAYHYQSFGTTFITETITTDSVRVVNGDSVFYWNEQVKKCDNCPNSGTNDAIFIRRLPHFLGKTMIKKANNEYLLVGNETFHLYPNNALNTSWQFSPNLTASVSSISVRNLWGNIDSVKTILLSNNDSILLSKNHGLLQFPSFSNLPNYGLAGIPTRGLGEDIANVHSIYDFNVGDVFFYEYNTYECLYGTATGFASKDKWTLIQKQNFSTDSTIYTFILRRKKDYIQDPTPFNYFYSIDTLAITATTSHTSNHFNGLIVGQSGQKNSFFYADIEDNTSPTDFRFITNVNNDQKALVATITYGYGFSLMTQDSIPVPENDHISIIWQKGLGEISASLHSSFQPGIPSGLYLKSIYAHQVGYVKNGITVGETFEDWYYTDISDKKEAIFSLYPNPSHEKLTLEFTESPTNIFITDITGRIMLSENHFQPTLAYEINIKNWAEGIYFLAVQNEKGNITTQKFIKE